MTIPLVFFTVPAVAAAQEYRGRASVEGTVVTLEGVGLPDVMVTATWAETSEGPEPVKTNGDGAFEVENLKPGPWIITAAAGPLGWGSDTVEITVLDRDTPEITLTLRTLQELAAEADQKFQAEAYAEARELYLQILTALPEMMILHQPIGLTYAAEGQHDDAVKQFDILLEGLDAQSSAGAVPPGTATEVQLAAAASLASLGDYEQMNARLDAIEDAYSEATVDAIVAIANNVLILEQEQYGEAVAVLDRAVEEAPNSPVPYYYRGIANVQLEDLDAARADLEKFVGMAPASSPLIARANQILESLPPAP